MHEGLEIANMTARPKPRPDGSNGYEPNEAAAKSGLNQAHADVNAARNTLPAGLALQEARNVT